MARFLPPVLMLLLVSTTSYSRDASTSAVGAKMAASAQQFLASLKPEQLAKVKMKFDDPARLDWHNIPKAERKGLQLRDMTADQRKQCYQLLAAGLSDVGYEKAMRVLSLENNLREGEKNQANGPLRDPERYFLTVFGTPSDAGEWGWSFEGHHFSLNFVIRDGQVVSDTPSFWGANPATVKTFIPGGPQVGTRTLALEEQLAFDLMDSLDESQKKQAIIAEKAPADYRAPGKPQPIKSAPEGLATADMTAAQKKILLSLLEAYCGNLASDLGAARLAEVKKSDLDRVYFAWSGATKPGIGHSYRVQGPTFVLELVNIQKDPDGNPANHIHSVWRNMKGDFGVPLE